MANYVVALNLTGSWSYVVTLKELEAGGGLWGVAEVCGPEIWMSQGYGQGLLTSAFETAERILTEKMQLNGAIRRSLVTSRQRF